LILYASAALALATAAGKHAAADLSRRISPTAAPTPDFVERFGGLPGVVGIVLGVVAIIVGLAVPIGLHVLQERKRREQHAAETAAQDAEDLERERLHVAGIKAKLEVDREKRLTMQWQLSEQILIESLFSGQPEHITTELVTKIITRIDEKLPSREDLFLATRLLIERWLLDTVRTRARTMSSMSGHAICAEILTMMDEVFRTRHDPRVIELENSFVIDEIEKRHPNATTYLQSLTSIAKGYESHGTIPNFDSFITRIEIKDGFVAPAYHIDSITRSLPTSSGGALSAFHEIYGETPIKDFNLLSWFLYGASIPMCTCRRWDGDFKVLQYGYDNEQLSFPLILEERVLKESWERIRRELLHLPGDHLPLAIGSKFTGRIVWGPQYYKRQTDFSLVFSVKDQRSKQKLHLRYYRDMPRRSYFDGIMLLADSVDRLPSPRRLYHTHLWILLEIINDDGTAIYQNRADRWRALYPVLESANLADGTVLISAKEDLAEKAWRQITEFEKSNRGKLLRYLCAFDDPGSVQNADDWHNFALAVHGPQGNVQTPDVAQPLGENRLRTLLAQRAPQRLFTPASERSRIITACDLPQIVTDFCREFSRRARGDMDEDRST
jgi:hypothetical protein